MAHKQSTNKGLRELALFAGAGGGILGGKLLGWQTVCAVEINSFCARRLMQRQNEGHLSPFPVWDDVRTFDGRPWKGLVDVVSGGFPCQDISCAGKGVGIKGERSGLWKEMVRIVGEVQPKYVFVENSPALAFRGLGTVLGDLSEMGFNARWGVMGAHHVGLQHKRERLWIVAYRDGSTFQLYGVRKVKNRKQQQAKIRRECWLDFLVGTDKDAPVKWRNKGFDIEAMPVLRRDIDGMAPAVDRIAAIGNGQVPAVAKLAWEVLSDNKNISSVR